MSAPRPATRRSLRLVAGVVFLGFVSMVSAVALWLLHRDEWDRYQSPNGDYEVVATSRRYLMFRLAMPGGGSDREGEIELFRTSDGRSCGRARLPMMWMSRDVRWDGPTATLIGAAVWNLSSCSVEPWD